MVVIPPESALWPECGLYNALPKFTLKPSLKFGVTVCFLASLMFVVFDKIESSDSSIVLTRFECLKIASKFERLFQPTI